MNSIPRKLSPATLELEIVQATCEYQIQLGIVGNQLRRLPTFYLTHDSILRSFSTFMLEYNKYVCGVLKKYAAIP